MNDAPPQILQAILLLGPTGSGKTPLGDWLERHGLGGRRCHHFDFGANLRAVAAAGPSSAFTHEDIQFLQRVLTEGVLLENESFHLAARILNGFVARHGVQPGHWLVLNGLPRHVGQAQALEQRVRVCTVAQLECDAGVVRERLRRDPAGDRAVRTDDQTKLVVRKLGDYEERTRPIVEYYRRRGVRVISFPVQVHTQPGEVARQFEQLAVNP